MKRLAPFILSLILCSFALLPMYAERAAAAPAAASTKKTPLQTTVDAMQPGWNLGNTFDATGGDETAWGNPVVTKELIDSIAAAGFKSIRLPVTWQERLGTEPDYTIDPAFMSRIQEVVDWSLDAGLYVIVNIHHDSSWIMNMETQHDEVLARFKAIWTQVAAHFKNYSEKLMFESVNEPRFSDDWNKDSPVYFEMLGELNTAFVHLVRASGGHNAQRPLVLPTIAASAAQSDRLEELLKTIESLKDKNLIATFHYYGYWQFSVNVAGVTTFANEAQTDLVNTFDRVYDTLSVKGIPVIVGEFGLLGFDKSLQTIEHGEVLKFFEYITYYAKEKGFPLMLWDNGQHFDRQNYKWSDEDLYDVIMEGMKSRSSTAETDDVYMKANAAATDKRIPLNLNGNTFTALKNGDKTLVQGTDYELDGQDLILKAGLLQSLLTGTTGVNAILNCSFSAGADWKLNVIAYDTPLMQSTEGSDSFFSIPTQFGGDRLATMEATYAEGGNAGPNDWTSYQEFGLAFSPEYENGHIEMKPDFLKTLKDGEEVTLNFHFGSGEIVPYKLKKQSSSVTGLSTQVDAPASGTANGATNGATNNSTNAPESEPANDKTSGSASAAANAEPESKPADAAPAVEVSQAERHDHDQRNEVLMIAGGALLVFVVSGLLLMRRSKRF
ncbi:cellulase family glycosylhydrolase [Paenibacillus rhizovicinus]|uniref:Cellulase family glycosylhydrolase n=1 Tax=Paenibacillus rhizovicinus TaxID=2704463 RepID=A0A6C0P102_9BACL|nr:cellulase family glycosylhydrolase [Paenibacillus rhizovicinus]QHW31906.1 cellulase family glycosylhydrolase [Paenibacillus rhizovicinus]